MPSKETSRSGAKKRPKRVAAAETAGGNAQPAPRLEEPSGGQDSRWNRLLTGWPAAGVVLAVFYAVMISSLVHKSATADEPIHLAGGYTYWRLNDYRINAENGNLPQRIGGLGALFYRPKFFDLTSDPGRVWWDRSSAWDIPMGFLYDERLHNDADALLLAARAAMGLLAVMLGTAVYACSRRLFGPAGGMLSLLLYVLNPGVLANGGLVASDVAGSLFLLASVWAVWATLRGLTPVNILAVGLAVGGLFVSKMSAPLVLFMATAMLIVRLAVGRPLPFQLFGRSGQIVGRARQGLAVLGVVAVEAGVVWGVIWAFYGFRYSMMNDRRPESEVSISWETLMDRPTPYRLLSQLDLTDDQLRAVSALLDGPESQARRMTDPDESWNMLERLGQEVRRTVLTDAQRQTLDDLREASAGRDTLAGTIRLLRRHKLLPEAFVYGYLHVFHYSQKRAAFLNGQTGETGWKSFFPYTFLVKTPLGLFAVLLFAVTAAILKWRARQRTEGGTFWHQALEALHVTMPLWVLLAVYWTFSILSHLNIGHRHVLPTYPPLFILAGAAALWLRLVETRDGRASGLIGWLKTRPIGALLCVVVAAMAVETALTWPNYLTYFNGIVSPRNAWKHLVDSSLDWGQDAPSLKDSIEEFRAAQPGTPVLLSYFGNGGVRYRGIQAQPLPGYGWDNIRNKNLVTLDWPAEQAEQRTRLFLESWPEFCLLKSEPVPDAPEPTVRCRYVKRPEVLRLAGGRYYISASMIQPLFYENYSGPWTTYYERTWQEHAPLENLIQKADEAQWVKALLTRKVEDIEPLLKRHQTIRHCRMIAFLRQREPVGNINYSILIYDLTDEDVQRMLGGDPPS